MMANARDYIPGTSSAASGTADGTTSWYFNSQWQSSPSSAATRTATTNYNQHTNTILQGVPPLPDTGSESRHIIWYWFSRFLRTGTVLDDTYGHGQPKVDIPTDVLRTCADELAEHHYLSTEGASHENTYIKGVLQQFNISMRYLMDRIHKAFADIAYCFTFEHKMELSPAVKTMRVDYAKMMKGLLNLALSISCLQPGPRPTLIPLVTLPFTAPAKPDLTVADCIVWIDQKKLYIKPPAHIKAWGYKHDHVNSTVIMDERLDRKHQGWRIYYYVAVNQLTGGLMIKMMTGTHGDNEPESHYTVSVMCRASLQCPAKPLLVSDTRHGLGCGMTL